jgi:hypothetical protein
MRRIAFALGVVFGIAVLLGAAPAGAGDGASPEGGSHLLLHDVFGLQTLELQDFGFNAKIKVDGSADGWYTYREVDDGSPISVDGPVTVKRRRFATHIRPTSIRSRSTAETSRSALPDASRSADACMRSTEAAFAAP